MLTEDIQNCYERAREVQDGFKQPSARLASDVIALIKHISAMQQTAAKPSGKVADSVSMNDIFGGIFK